MNKHLATFIISLALITPLATSADTIDAAGMQSQVITLLQQIISLQKTIIDTLTTQIAQLQQQVTHLQVQAATSHVCAPVTPPTCTTTLSPSYDAYDCVIGYSCASSANVLAPTATLIASPTSITTGGNATLTWHSANASSCTRTGFTANDVAGSATVSPQTTTTYTLTCTNSAGNTVASATVVVTTPLSCTFNGQIIADGKTITAYQAASVPSGQQCLSQVRTCRNGILDGSYTNPTCKTGGLTDTAASISTIAGTTNSALPASSSGCYIKSQARWFPEGTNIQLPIDPRSMMAVPIYGFCKGGLVCLASNPQVCNDPSMY